MQFLINKEGMKSETRKRFSLGKVWVLYNLTDIRTWKTVEVLCEWYHTKLEARQRC